MLHFSTDVRYWPGRGGSRVSSAACGERRTGAVSSPKTVQFGTVFGTFFHSSALKILVHLCTISSLKNCAFFRERKRNGAKFTTY
jgi:hypothetical protein